MKKPEAKNSCDTVPLSFPWLIVLLGSVSGLGGTRTRGTRRRMWTTTWPGPLTPGASTGSAQSTASASSSPSGTRRLRWVSVSRDLLEWANGSKRYSSTACTRAQLAWQRERQTTCYWCHVITWEGRRGAAWQGSIELKDHLKIC